MKTRQDYMENKVSHHEYYAQFVTPEIERMVSSFGIEKLKSSFDLDKNLNNIPLHIWDDLGRRVGIPVRKLKEAGDGDSLAGRVCILKSAARKVLGL